MNTIRTAVGKDGEITENPQSKQNAGEFAGTAERLTWLTCALCLLVTGTAAVYELAGPIWAVPVGLAGLLAAAGWQSAEARNIRVPVSFVVPYLLLVMSLLAQQAAEFAGRAAEASAPFSVSGFAVYSIGAAAAFMLGASALTLRHPLGDWAAWLVCAWSVLQSLAHYAYPIAASGHYAHAPVQLLAWLPLAIGLYGLFRLCRPFGNSPRRGGRSHE
ncbi:hypothetical protein CDO73_22305 [Saccharibacillus sp. O23]|uniref:hypothetical protein n=1 Tax=Saccharibacillus sp. O23 TaxID=2009338 RepID=UPI000B4DF282|nr:hypothetical protein [Saccharibacillus sp. O23]OWR27357.1 hypothetical protein CDO73_22305 [Saccharibacillus sp. O23]